MEAENTHRRERRRDDKFALASTAVPRVALLRDLVASGSWRDLDQVVEFGERVDRVHERLNARPRQATFLLLGEDGVPLRFVLECSGFLGRAGRGPFLQAREGRDDRVAVRCLCRAREEVLLLPQRMLGREFLSERRRKDARSVDFEEPVRSRRLVSLAFP